MSIRKYLWHIVVVMILLSVQGCAKDEVKRFDSGQNKTVKTKTISVSAINQTAVPDSMHPPFDLVNAFFWGNIEEWWNDAYEERWNDWYENEYLAYQAYWRAIDSWYMQYRQNKTWNALHWHPNEKCIIAPDLELNGIWLGAKESRILQMLHPDEFFSVTEEDLAEATGAWRKTYWPQAGFIVRLEKYLDSDEGYKVVYLETASPNAVTYRGLKVGDDIERLVEIYGEPGHIVENEWCYSDIYNDLTYAVFTVDEGIIQKIAYVLQ